MPVAKKVREDPIAIKNVIIGKVLLSLIRFDLSALHRAVYDVIVLINKYKAK
jgi:hypothetical protein